MAPRSVKLLCLVFLLTTISVYPQRRYIVWRGDESCGPKGTGIEANEERCRELIEYSISMATSLAPIIGYDKAAEIAKQSVKTGKTVREICQEMNILPEDELKAALDPESMTAPSV